MSKVAIKGNASGTGTFTLEAPNSNTDRTLVLPDEAGTVLTSAGAGTDYLTPTGDGSSLTGIDTDPNAPLLHVSMSNQVQYMGSSSWTRVNMNQETVDTDNQFASYRFTPTIAGWYYICVALSFQGSGGSEVYGSIVKNGTQYTKYIQHQSGGGSVRIQVDNLLLLNGSTDYVEPYAWTNATSSVGVFGDNNGFETSMLAFLVRTA